MIQDFVNALAAHRQAVGTALRGGAFLTEVEHFSARLHALPHHTASELSAEQFDLINSLSDQMIEAVENRIDQGEDDEDTRRKLAESVYRIRRHLEEIYRWHKPNLET
jgi:hypothetical protein